jgi:hypothetical protein
VYDLMPFRTLTVNGAPVFELHRYPSPRGADYALTAAEADDLAKLIVSLLNGHEIAWEEIAAGKDVPHG